MIRMSRLTTSQHPERVELDLSGQQLVFVRVGDDLYAAELDGKRLPIRRERLFSQIDEGGGRDPWPPEQSEGDTAHIDTILICLSLDAAPTPIPRGVKLEARHDWGHFRQFSFLKISITIAESGLIEFNENIQEMDGSYY